MTRGIFRLWIVSSLILLGFVAVRTWMRWPEDILWDNGISSRQEVLINACLMISVPSVALLCAILVIWAMRGFRA